MAQINRPYTPAITAYAGNYPLAVPHHALKYSDTNREVPWQRAGRQVCVCGMSWPLLLLTLAAALGSGGNHRGRQDQEVAAAAAAAAEVSAFLRGNAAGRPVAVTPCCASSNKNRTAEISRALARAVWKTMTKVILNLIINHL